MEVQETAAGLREKILREATRLFVERGYTGISMREIAEGVGVSKAGLYYHFKDKEDLLLAILEDNLALIAQMIRRCRAATETGRGQVTLIARAIFEQPPEQRAVIRLASQEIGNLKPEIRSTFGKLYHAEFIGQIEAVLRNGMDRGEFRKEDSTVSAWILLGMMYPFFYPGQNKLQEDEVIEKILDVFFDGVVACHD